MTLTTEIISELQHDLADAFGYFLDVDAPVPPTSNYDLFAKHAQTIAGGTLTKQDIRLLYKQPPLAPRSLWHADFIRPRAGFMLDMANFLGRFHTNNFSPSVALGDDLFNQGNSKFDAANYAEALASFQRAAEIFRMQQRRESEVAAMIMQGHCYTHLADLATDTQDKIQHLRVATDLFDAADSDPLQIAVRVKRYELSSDSMELVRLGEDFSRLTKMELAGACYLKSGEILIEKSKQTHNTALLSIAIDSLLKAATNFAYCANGPGLLATKLQLANTMSLLGEHERAAVHYAHAANIAGRLNPNDPNHARQAEFNAFAGREAVLIFENTHSKRHAGLKQILAWPEISERQKLLDELAATLHERGYAAAEAQTLTTLSVDLKDNPPPQTARTYLNEIIPFPKNSVAERLSRTQSRLLSDFLSALGISTANVSDTLTPDQASFVLDACQSKTNIDARFATLADEIKNLATQNPTLSTDAEFLTSLVLCRRGASNVDSRMELSTLTSMHVAVRESRSEQVDATGREARKRADTTRRDGVLEKVK